MSESAIPLDPLAALLVGGQSRRFGSDKATHRLGGRTFAQWVLDAVEPTSLQAIVVGGAADQVPGQAAAHLADDPSGSGPVAGLWAALRYAHENGRPGVLLLACDQPGITTAVVQALVEQAASDPAAPLAFQGSTGLEPFPAYYPVKILESELRARSLRAVLEAARPVTRVISATERAVFGESTFANINTPEELERFLTRRRS